MRVKNLGQAKDLLRKLQNERKVALQEGWRTEAEIEALETKIAAVEARIEEFHNDAYEDDDEGNGNQSRKRNHRAHKGAYR